MHDPMTVAHEIKSPFYRMTPFGTKYHKSLVTIWHVDPETDHTDDSCGWFIRPRHVDKSLRESVQREFAFQLKHHYWWDENGFMRHSEISTLVNMYKIAVYKVLGDWDKTDNFLRKHLHEIITFSENDIDCIFQYRKIIKTEEQTNDLADVVLTDVLRKLRPWYKHPKWHIRHWKVQIHWPRWLRKGRGKEVPCCDHNLRETV